MQSMDHEVLEHVATWIDSGYSSWLCTIVSTIGSSPRPAGSIAAVTDEGHQIGSVSGGCVEEDLIERLRSGAYSGERPELIEYGVSAEENERLGLPCGGRITLLLQRLATGDKHWVDGALAALKQRRCIERKLHLNTGETTLKPVEHHSAISIDGAHMRQCFGPRMRMLLVGAGQLSRSVAELALAMDYEVMVTDPRQELLDQWEGPALALRGGMPDDVVREFASDKHSVIITLTHDPRIDDMALMEALQTDAWYVGALGSLRTTQKRLDRLRQLDLSEQHLARLHAPVGLNIGSKTPIEIAVAILAQLTQLRREAIVS
ncbi:MAG: XdhC family protein [Halioglobus sp.]|nr:XdhC family protein [Halioglobus sp.]